MVGLGAPTVTMIRRPGLYGGFSYNWDAGWALDLRTGLYRAGPSFDVVQFRIDIAGRLAITKQIGLRAGAALVQPPKNATDTLDYELSVGPWLSF